MEQRDSLLLFVGEFDADVEHTELGHIKKGTVSYEYYWLDRWYNIFRFHEPSGRLRNFYCNISMPPRFEDGILDYVDLDIDVLVDRDFNTTVLDREDYELNSAEFNYPADLHTNVETALNELLEVFDIREMPGLPELFATSDVPARECG